MIVKHYSLILAAAVFAAPLHAQSANPMSTELLQMYTIIKTNLLKMVEKMPDGDYTFRPVPEVETFAQRVNHIARANLRTCAGLKGVETRPLEASPANKTGMITELRESFAFCDSVFTSLTDAKAVEMVEGRIGSPPSQQPRTRLSTMWNVVRHSNELYGYMAVYLRLNGVVPPTSSPD